MPRTIATDGDRQEEGYRGRPHRQRLELLAFDARHAGEPQALLEALWGAIDAGSPKSPGQRRAAKAQAR